MGELRAGISCQHRVLSLDALTNSYVDLQPVLAALAEDAGLVGLIERDGSSASEIEKGALPSVWAVIGRSAKDLGNLADDSRWKPLLGKPGSKLWTDDFSSVISVFLIGTERRSIEVGIITLAGDCSIGTYLSAHSVVVEP
jgi:hypothetical protein